MSDLDLARPADLGGQPIYLVGRLPAPGTRLLDVFTIPPARRAEGPLTEADFASGLVLLSPLPNIQRHACVAQIVQLEETAHRFDDARIIHVSHDEAVHWHEVDRYHPNIRAASYSLRDADGQSRTSFIWAFGVGVLGHDRIAHGLFALRDGVFLAAEVPYDQLRAPEVDGFLHQLHQSLEEQPCR